MKKIDILRALKDIEFRNNLSDEEKAQLPTVVAAGHLTAAQILSPEQLANVVGGQERVTDGTGGTETPSIPLNELHIAWTNDDPIQTQKPGFVPDKSCFTTSQPPTFPTTNWVVSATSGKEICIN